MPQVHLPPSMLYEEETLQRAREAGVSEADLNRLVQAGIVTSHPRVVSGAFVFAGTRVPLYNLWDYLAAGDSLEDFLESFPTVPRSLAEQTLALVEDGFKGDSFHS